MIKHCLKISYAILIYLLLATSIKAQKEASNWFFGGFPPFASAGIKFNDTSVQAYFPNTNHIHTLEGCATISDKFGNLLFYTDGVTAFNANHDTLLNGKGLAGSFSSSQSAVIIDHPGEDSLKILLCVDAEAGLNPSLSNGIGGVTYSIVDMRLDNGLGGIDTLQKNKLLITPTVEKITAVDHCNQEDTWVITEKFGIDSLYYSYLFSTSGIVDTFVSKVGIKYDTLEFTSTLGYLRPSPDGSKVANAIYAPVKIVQVLKFDNATGELYDPIILDSSVFDGLSPYGVSFSPDNQLLYVSAFYDDALPWKTAVYQFDVSTHEVNAIIASKETLISKQGSVFGAMQIGIDHKIYVAKKQGPSLGLIEFPNQKGVSALFKENGFNLNAGVSFYGLPNFNESYFYQASQIQSESSVCLGDSSFFRVSYTSENHLNYYWDLDDGTLDTGFSISHIYTWGDTFEARLITESVCRIDTVYFQVYVDDFSNHTLYIGEDTTICTGDSLVIESNIDSAFFLWSDGSSTKSIIIHTAQEYSLAATKTGVCVLRDTINISIDSLYGIILNEQDFCTGNSIMLETSSNGLYIWNTGDTSRTIMVNESGTYSINIQNKFGCVLNDTILIEFISCNDLTLPQIFSPNNDKLNDDLNIIYDDKNWQLIYFYIYNRWGEKVFETNDITQGWDGTYEDRSQPIGEYVTHVAAINANSNKEVYISLPVILIR